MPSDSLPASGSSTSRSNPDVRRAVEVMEGEISMFSEIMGKINDLFAEVRDYRERNDLRLEQVEEAMRHREAVAQEAPLASDNDDRLRERDEVIRQLRDQLQEQRQELDSVRQELQEARGLHHNHTTRGSERDPNLQNSYRQSLRQDMEFQESQSLATATTRPVSEVLSRPVPNGGMPPVPSTTNRMQDMPLPLPCNRPPVPDSARHQMYPPQPQWDQMPASSHQNLPPSQSSSGIVNYVLSKETVPHFRGDAPASQPLRKNQEVEGWIRAIENIVKPPTSEAYIQAARASCRGAAELLVNSPLFDSIGDWQSFKAALRNKFRGTYTSADFYKVLYEIRMSTTQAPMDFFLQLEGNVYQGYRDHPEAVGDPSQLVKRVFLSGLPTWLRDFLALKEDGSPSQIAEAAQRIWNSRHGIHHSSYQSTGPDQFTQHSSQPPRTRDVYAMTVSAPLPSHQPTLPVPDHHKWCVYHQLPTHNTSECRARGRREASSPLTSRRCYECRNPGHFARECPFRQSQGSDALQTPGRDETGGMYQGPDSLPGSSRRSESPRLCRTTTRATQC